MANIFLSYDHEDVALARPIAVSLEKAGHSVWYDRHIHGGAQYSRKIEQALDAADAVIVLWSPRSLDSAWVRDEAADGRDRGKLVPLSVNGVTPPMGFRQFQTIDLGAWKGRGKVPHLDDLLEAVQSQARESTDAPISPIDRNAASGSKRLASRWIAGAAAVLAIIAIGLGAWNWLGRTALPVVEVAAANGSPRSQAAASDLFVKLGSLAEVGGGKWKLVDEASAPDKPSFLFRTADTGSASAPQANLVLLDGKDDSLLWSREFSFPAGAEADLRQQLSLTAGRVLGCALESRDAGGLPRDLLKLFLNACATIAESSQEEPAKATQLLRPIVVARPKFTPALGRLLSADMTVIDNANNENGEAGAATQTLRADMARARRVAPELPELTIADAYLLPPTAYGQRLQLLQKASAQTLNVAILSDLTNTLQRVGRMSEAVETARQAAGLDPLSPAVTTQYVMMLAAAGRLDDARHELARAERLWAGTGALRDALWAFHLRYGDPAVARRNASFRDEGLDFYLNARADPSPGNVKKLVGFIQQFANRRAESGWAWAVPALGQFGYNDEAFQWLAKTPRDTIAAGSYILFRPTLADLRKDPRFIAVAKRIGLVDYWRASGKWPDFCGQPGLPYDCKAEAAKYG